MTAERRIVAIVWGIASIAILANLIVWWFA